MKWDQVRNQYPDSWVLFEAIEAHSDSGKRVIEDIAVLDRFETGSGAMKRYIELHKNDPIRELFIYNTINEKLDIKERLWMGVRRA